MKESNSYYGPHDTRLENVPDSPIKLPADAIVRVEPVAFVALTCGSDLWPYRGVTSTQALKPPNRLRYKEPATQNQCTA